MEINYNKPIKNSFKQNYPNSIPQLNSSSESNNTVSNHIVVNRRWTRLDPIGDDAIFFSSPPHCNARVPLIICNRIPRWNSHFVSLYSFLHPLTTYPQLIIPILVRHSPRAELFAVSFAATHIVTEILRGARVCANSFGFNHMPRGVKSSIMADKDFARANACIWIWWV